VALVRSSGRNVTEVARELGVSPEGLRGWVKQAKIDRGEGAPGALTTAEKDELQRLRRENWEQQQKLKRAQHTNPPRPDTPTVTIAEPTKTTPTRRKDH
jgi:transposase-like protein